MGRLQSRVTRQAEAPVALLSGIALSSEDTLRYGRHRQKAVISLWSHSLVLLAIGSTPPSASYRSRPVAQSEPMLFCVASPLQSPLRVPAPC